jgi:hypothetical protein
MCTHPVVILLSACGLVPDVLGVICAKVRSKFKCSEEVCNDVNLGVVAVTYPLLRLFFLSSKMNVSSRSICGIEC